MFLHSYPDECLSLSKYSICHIWWLTPIIADVRQEAEAGQLPPIQGQAALQSKLEVSRSCIMRPHLKKKQKPELFPSSLPSLCAAIPTVQAQLIPVLCHQAYNGCVQTRRDV